MGAARATTPVQFTYDAQRRQTRRLRRFLAYDLAVEVGAAVSLLGMFAVFRSLSLLLVGILLVGNTLLLLWARRQIDLGRLQTAVTGMALALWLIVVAVAVLIPPAFVVAPLLLMESVVIALPYADRRRLRQLIAGTVIIAFAIMPFARAGAGPFPLDMLPAWFVLAVLVVSVPTIIGLLLYWVWQYSDLLRETLAQTQHANAALASSQRQLAEHVRELQASRTRIVRAQEGVRREIAAHLHGRVQGRLLVLRGRLLELLGRTTMPAELPSRLSELAEALALIVEEDLSALSRRLYPAILRRGLVPALESLADHFDTAVAVTVQIDPALRCAEQTRCNVLPEPVRLGAYRIAEEALTNVLKHAGATTVRLNLDWSPDRALRLDVADDGRGFDVTAAGDGLGMAAIHDYAATVGGASSVRSTPGAGTEIVAILPLPAHEPALQPKAGSLEETPALPLL